MFDVRLFFPRFSCAGSNFSKNLFKKNPLAYRRGKKIGIPMFKKSLSCLLGFLITGCALMANDGCGCDCSCPWITKVYLRLGTGVSFSEKAQIHAPSAIWDRAKQGYNSDLESAPIITAGLGCDIGKYFSTDITFAARLGYKYRKFQIGIPNPNVAGFLGNKTRRFNLDVYTAMWNVYLNGRGCDYLSWNFNCLPGSLYPVIGGGIGVSRLKIFNFRSTGIKPVDDDIPAFASENQYTVRYHFTYQVMAGLEYNHCDRWALCIGYRWFDAGKFKGPRYFRNAQGLADDFGHHEWDIRLRANEFLIEAKFFL